MAVHIQRLGPFADLSAREAAAASEIFCPRAFRRDERIVGAGRPPLGVILLVEGRLRIVSVTLRGLEVTLRRHCAGSVAGLECLLPERDLRPPAEVVAETDGSLAHASAERIAEAMDRLPGLSRVLVTEAVRQLQDAEEFVRRMASSAVLGRVAAALLELPLPASGAAVPREVLASRAAASRESASRALHRLAGAGHVELIGKSVRILDRGALRRLATTGQPAPCYGAAGGSDRAGICSVDGSDGSHRNRPRRTL